MPILNKKIILTKKKSKKKISNEKNIFSNELKKIITIGFVVFKTIIKYYNG